MHWIIQNDTYNQNDLAHLISVLDQLKLPRSIVKTIPLDNSIEVVEGEKLPTPGSKALIIGEAPELVRTAKKRGWVPGLFIENLDFTIQRKYWGSQMLNSDAAIHRFEEIPKRDGAFFLKSVTPSKALPGAILDWSSYTEWLVSLHGIIKNGHPETAQLVARDVLDAQILVCPKKEILSETRTWIVDGKLVTCSSMDNKPSVEERITIYASRRAQVWSPNKAYVLDIADTKKDGLKIVEVNNISTATWYRGDLLKIIQALESVGTWA